MVVLVVGSVVLGTLLVPYGASGKTSTRGGIPAKVRAALLKDAKSMAASAGRRRAHPYDIQAVLTTEAKARTLDEGRNETLLTVGSGSVYVVAMRGTFRVICEGGPCPANLAPGNRRTYPVLMFWVPVSTMEVAGPDSDVFTGYPNLASAGVPVRLNPKLTRTSKTMQSRLLASGEEHPAGLPRDA